MSSPIYSEPRFVENRYTRSDLFVWLAAQEAGQDTASVTVNVGVTASLAATEAGQDTALVNVAVAIDLTLAASEAGPDLASFDVDVIATATLAVQEEGQDTASVSTTALITVNANIQEAPDTASISMAVANELSLAAVEAPDTAAFELSANATIWMSAEETGQDTANATFSAPIALALAATEEGKDTAFILAKEITPYGQQVTGNDPDLDDFDLDYNAEQLFFPGVYEDRQWSVDLHWPTLLDDESVPVDPLIETTLLSHPENPGITIEKISEGHYRISGAYVDLFDEEFDYMETHDTFINRTTSDRDPAWYLVGWTPPPVREKQVEFTFELRGLFTTETVTIQQWVYWSDTIALAELDTIIRKAA